jgi:hypothetical protein
MLSLLLPASVSALKSRGIPAVQSGRVVVAVARLQSDRVAGWQVTLAAGIAGGSCRPIAQATVSGRTRAQARHAAVAIARQYAQALAGGELPPPLPPTPARAAEPLVPYGAAGVDVLEHVEVEILPSGGFLLTLTGAGYDGTCEPVAPQEAALWGAVEALSGLCHARATSAAALARLAARESLLHARLLALLRSRRRRHRRAA